MDFKEIDDIIKKAEECEEFDEFYEVLNQIKMPYREYSAFVDGKDEFSEEYIQGIREVHLHIIKNGDRGGYSYNDEGMNEIDVQNEEYCDWPFESSYYTTRFLHAYANIIKVMNLLPGAKILEPGCGLGSLTELLVRMGYEVDAVDVNKDECIITEKRIARIHRKCNVICSDFESFLETCNKKYDAVVFFEAFHHFLNHNRIIEKIKENNLKKNGKIILSGEPILKDDVSKCILPYPWGPRLDGESVLQMRKRGWLELGFRESYIRAMGEKLGMKVTHIPSTTGEHGEIWLLDVCLIDKRDVCLIDKRDVMLNKYRDFCANLLSNEKNVKVLQEILQGKFFCIYGLGKVGRALVSSLEGAGLKGILDKFCKDYDFRGLPIYHPDAAPAEWHDYDILVTPLTDCKEVCQQLTQAGYRGRILDIYEIVQKQG